MTALRQRFIEDLQLHGFAASTQQVYVTAIKLLARHYRQSPDQLTEEQIRQYFLYLTNERKVSRSNATITLCAIKFLYEHTLQRPWPVFRVARPRREHKIPAVMSREEVRQLLGCFKTPFYRVFFTTVYACGLRVSEGVQLQVSDVDGQRLLLHVRGKGNRDRNVPLPAPVLAHAPAFLENSPLCSLVVSLALSPNPKFAISAGNACRESLKKHAHGLDCTSMSPFTRCVTRTPRTCWKPASICG